MKNEGAAAFKHAKVESKKTTKMDPAQTMDRLCPPRFNIDPEKRRDFFNNLLETYAKKTNKSMVQPSSPAIQKPKAPAVTPTKPTSKVKEKVVKKKKSSDKVLVKNPEPEVVQAASDCDEKWKMKIRHYKMDPTVYKNHQKISSRFPYPMAPIDESQEQITSEADLGKSPKKMNIMESVNHAFTFLHIGDQQNVNSNNCDIKYEEKRTKGPNRVPEELQARRLTRSHSGTLLWIGNDSIHQIAQSKEKKGNIEKYFELRRCPIQAGDLKPYWKDFAEPQKTVKSVRHKTKKTKTKKCVSQDLEEGSKSKQTEKKVGSSGSKASSSSSVQEEMKSQKKVQDKLKVPKKMNKKQSFTIVTSKPSI